MVAGVLDEEEIAAGTFDFLDGGAEGIGGAEIIDGGVEVFAGTVGFFDFESIEGLGMDDAESFAFAVDDRKVSEAGFVELVESERAEDFGVFDKNHVGLR